MDRYPITDRASDKKLAAALEDLYDRLKDEGIHDLADRAARGEFNDYFGRHDGMELHALDAELAGIRGRYYGRGSDHANAMVAEINHLRQRIRAGDFDGTKAESDEWARSPEGREVFRELLDGRRRS